MADEPVKSGITDDNVEKAETLLDKYLKDYNAVKGGGEDKSGFLRPIAEGFTPAVTSKASSVLGMKANPAVLAAIGGLASGLSGGKKEELSSSDLSKMKYEQGLGKEEFDKATKLADGYSKDIKEFKIRQMAWNTINAVAKDPSPAGDLALIFAYMKLLDPGSTVREGEFANAEKAGSVPDAVWNMYNRLLTGERLDKTRPDFLKKAQTIYKAQERTYANTLEEFKNKAVTAGLSKQYIDSYIPDYRNSTSAFDLNSLKEAVEKPAKAVKPAMGVRETQAKDIEMADFILASPADFEKEQVEWAKKIKGVK